MTWDDASFNNPKLWLDGAEVSYDTTITRSGAIVTDASNNLYMGNDGSGTRAFSGDIAWLRISDSVRYTAAFTPPTRYSPPAADANTVEQWNFDDNGAGTLSAEVSSNNDCTITNGTWKRLPKYYEYDVALSMWLPASNPNEAVDDSITKSGYITIAPTPSDPLNVDELVAIAAEIKKHIGCISDGTWVQEGAPNTSVYTMTVARKWADGYTYTVKEDGADLSSQASIVACQAAAGSYYVAYSDPDLAISVHPTNSDDPSTNGSVYSLRFT
jgi:hypothetical protein